jgi:hypothetical protein
MDPSGLLRRINQYAAQHGLVVRERLGLGVDGIVFKAEFQSEARFSALKAYWHDGSFHRERDVYLRLRDRRIEVVRSSNVPQLVGFDDELQVLEMTIVTPPFVLDFAKATLDHAPDFSEEVLADWLAAKADEFGPRWPEVQAILRVLEVHGIFMNDASARNITWPG